MDGTGVSSLEKPIYAEIERAPERFSELTRRECQILALIARGKANKEIARELGVVPETIKAHARSIYKKLGVANRTNAAIVAAAHGFRFRDLGPDYVLDERHRLAP